MDRNKKNKYFYILAFLIPFFLMLLIYAIRGVFPFGDNSVLVLDLNGQYVYYYEAFRDVFFNGKSLLYSFSRTLGGEMMGIYAYYLASPFSIVLVLFPKRLITEAVLTMILLKIGTAGLCFFHYLRKSKDGKNIDAIIFTTLYALMGYMVVQTMNPMWLDAVAFLPIAVLGLERLVDKKKNIQYIIFLTLIMIANFYIGYMTGIFLFFYFLYYIFGASKHKHTGFELLNRFFIFAYSSILAVGMSLWVILPTYYSLKMGKFTFTEPNFEILQKLDLFDLFSKMLPLTYDSVNYHGQPFIYCGLITCILVSLYFVNSKITAKKRIAGIFYIALFVTCFTVSTLDIVLHGFQEPNWLNYRYSFILSFFLVNIAYESFTTITIIDSKSIVRTSFILVVLTALIGRFDYEYITSVPIIWATYGGLLGYAILLYLYKSSETKKRKFIVTLVLICVILIELGFNCYELIQKGHEEVYYSDRPSYRDYFDNLYPSIDYIQANDAGFYRTETKEHRTVNDPMALGLYGLSNSSSVLNTKVIDFLYQLGLSSREHWTKFKGTTIVSDSILGIKYIISETPINNQYTAIFTDESSTEKQPEVMPLEDNHTQETNISNITVYENFYTLPIAFPVGSEYTNIKVDHNNPFINQNTLLSVLAGKTYTEYFKLLSIREILFENINAVNQGSYVSYETITPDINAHIEYILETAGDNEMYMYLYSEYPRVVNIWKDKEFIDTFFESESTCIMPLGANPNKETISLITTPTEEEYYLNNNMFYYLDMPLFKKTINKINEKDVTITKINERKLKIIVTAEQGELLFTTIPYEKGWRAKINGEKVATFEAMDALLSMELVDGTQEIQLSFIPEGFVLGLSISLIGLLITFLLVLIQRKRKFL